MPSQGAAASNTPSAVDVTAVVVTHNRPDDLKAVIRALLAQSRVPDRILVMDNASQPPAHVVLGSHPRVEIHRSDVNCGGAGGFAWGMAQALVRPSIWVWLMDDDAVPDREALRQLLVASEAPLLKHKPIASLGAAVYEFGDIALTHRRTFSPSWGWEAPVARARYGMGPQRIDTTSFVGCLIATEAIRAVGLPNDQLFLSYDDTEYALRLSRSGRQNWLVPASKIDHRRQPGGRLSRTAFGPRHYYNIRNRIVVCRQYSQHAVVSGLIATLMGVALWVRSGGGQAGRRASFKRLVVALIDGWGGRLGTLIPPSR